MPPNLAQYQAAANSIYEPQKAAEQNQITATRDTTKNALEAEKGQVNTDYQSAIDQLTQSVQDQTSQINQLYSQRLGGNFSGLQGNDMGQMFSKANQTQGIIASTRANKLGEITAAQTNADIDYGAGIASLAPKYQSLESQYAQNAYGSAVKDFQDNQYKQAQLQLSYARLGVSAGKANSAAADKEAKQYKLTGKSSYDSNGAAISGSSSTNNGYIFTGPNNKPINMAQYVAGAGMGVSDVLDLLSNGTKDDQGLAKYIQTKINNGTYKTEGDVINAIKGDSKNKYYGF